MDVPVKLTFPRTFGDLIQRALHDPALSMTQCRNLASALRRFSEVDGRSAAMPCDAHAVRAAIGRINPARHRISPQTWANVVSQVRRACRLYGVLAAGKHYTDLLSEDWRPLRDRLAHDPRLRRGLSRLITWANRTGCEPCVIDDQRLKEFHRHLEEVALVRDAPKLYRDACCLWNRAAHQIPDWPQQLLTIPVRSRNFSLDWNKLPGGLLADLEAYCAIFGGERPFDPRSPRTPLRPLTLNATRQAIRRLASAAILAGVAPEQLTSLASLLERPNLEPALTWYRKRVGDIAPSLFEAVAKLVAIGRNYLCKSENELAELLGVMKRLNSRERGMTNKNLERLRPFAQPHHLAGFVHFGDRHRRQAHPTLMRRAQAFEIALLHDLLLCAPIRFGNMIALRIGQHIIIEESGRGVSARIQIPQSEVKNKIELTFELPARVAVHLSRYLREFRPHLTVGPANDFLFPGAKGGHLTSVALGDRLCNAIRRQLGLEVNPHLYRHIAAFVYLQQHPGEYETVRQLLGHKSLSTTMTFYTVFESWMSQRAYHKVLDRHLAPAAE